ncbi:hypothetical protein [Pukyongiella litopenaei]|uniref:hypothetical protein n=1 Tax=Pukyongiella litopenaei TaxID=2605946 RepID=UPI001B807F1C|nr:hypothetical protein [Pukyongiella litopenaei]
MIEIALLVGLAIWLYFSQINRKAEVEELQRRIERLSNRLDRVESSHRFRS